MLKLITKLKDKLQGKVPKGHNRSGSWPKVRKEHLELYPTCAVCGGTKSLQVHHKMPFSSAPELELDPSNLITLCENGNKAIDCHIVVGHSFNFKGFNPDVEKDAAYLLAKKMATSDRLKGSGIMDVKPHKDHANAKTIEEPIQDKPS